MAWNEDVWELVALIPCGKVATYGQLAGMLGFPRRSRHVGFALKQTPDGLALPWHRVINSRGEISLPPLSEGWHLQQHLLKAEGVVFNDNHRISLKKFGWKPLDEMEEHA